MSCVSGAASENLLIQEKETVLFMEHIQPESFCAYSYGDEWLHEFCMTPRYFTSIQ